MTRTDLELDRQWYRDGNLRDYERFAQWAGAGEPQLPSAQRQGAPRLSADERSRYDKRRIWHNSHMPLVTPPLITTVRAEMDQRLAYNETVEDGRKHVIIDGEGGLGKSSAARDYARRTYQRYAAGDENERPLVPVVWVKVPAAEGVEPLLQTIARFLIYPFRANTVGRQALLVAEYVAKCGTALMVLDDVHRLHEQRRSKDSTINLLKWFSDTAGLGYLITAVDLRSKGLVPGLDQRHPVVGTGLRHRRAPQPRRHQRRRRHVARTHRYPRKKVDAAQTPPRNPRQQGAVQASSPPERGADRPPRRATRQRRQDLPSWTDPNASPPSSSNAPPSAARTTF